MPPKGRGRARGGGQGPQQPGRPQEQQQVPRQQPQPQAVQSPPPQQQQQPPSERPRERQVAPEELGFRFESSLKLATPLPRKPEPGRLGRPIRLRTNHYALNLPGGNVYHYDVEIISKGRSQTTEEVKKEDKKYRCMSTKRNREIIVTMLKLDAFKNSMAAYDGRKNIYTRKALHLPRFPYKVDVQMPDENPGPPGSPERTDNFEVVIKPVNKKDGNSCAISLDPIHALFQQRIAEIPQDAIMAIETILRHGPCLRYSPVGRSFFYKPQQGDIHPLGGGKEIWFGYHQSLRLGQWKPTVNLDITATTFYEAKSLLKYVADFMRLSDERRLKEMTLRDNDIARIGKELKNLRIETNHMKKYKRKYKVLKLTRESANSLKFTTTDNGRQMTYTVAQYFAQKYFQLQYPGLPCVQVNPEAKKVYLPLEVCDVVEGQHCKKKLEERQNAEMIKFTARPPKQRFNEIRDILRRANYEKDEHLNAFGISVSKDPLTLQGRVIDPPSVRYDNDKQIRPRDGQWDMRDTQYFKGAEIKSWVLLSFSNPNFCNTQMLNKFARLLCDIASEQGIGISRPAAIETVDMRRASMHNVLKNYQSKFSVNLAVCVVPATNKIIYGDVKQAAETLLGLSTQCIKDESVVKKCNPPLVSNLCQKINAKMGGINNSLTPGEKPAIFQKPVIIIGADVTHPAPSHDIKPSIAAAVGSLDAHPSRYAVTLRAQTNVNEKKESIEEILDLKGMVLDLLKAFYKNTNGRKPEKIIFYRDGVSEGQFTKVRDFEVTAIREACRTLEREYEPGITFVVVQKRHHTRFMPEDERQGSGKMKNVPPGTLVDNTVVHPLNYDFFLCSHFGLQGTSRPCHYTVIEDDNNFKADDLQKLTYYLCHTYVRCTKSISSPAPVMYAHLAAFRARQHLVSQVDESSSSDDSSATYRPLPEAVLNAIKVQDVLKNTMYFV